MYKMGEIALDAAGGRVDYTSASLRVSMRLQRVRDSFVIPDARGASDPESIRRPGPAARAQSDPGSIFECSKLRWILNRALAARPE